MSYVMSASHLKTGAEKNLVTADGVPTPFGVISRRVSAGSRGDRTPLTETKKVSNFPQNDYITLFKPRGNVQPALMLQVKAAKPPHTDGLAKASQQWARRSMDCPRQPGPEKENVN